LDAKEELNGLTSNEIQQRKVAKDDWAKITLMEEIFWRQKSRTLRLKASDWNTKFFHRVANLHRKFNHMPFVVKDGVHCEVLQDMKSAIHDFYKYLSTRTNQFKGRAGSTVRSLGLACKVFSILTLPNPHADRHTLDLTCGNSRATRSDPQTSLNRK